MTEISYSGYRFPPEIIQPAIWLWWLFAYFVVITIGKLYLSPIGVSLVSKIAPARSLIPVLTPHGSLRLDQAEDEFSLEDGLGERLERCFTRGSGHGLLQLGAGEAGTSLPSSLAWWRDFAIRFVADLCALGETAEADERRLPAPAASDLTALIDKAPPMGATYQLLSGWLGPCARPSLGRTSPRERID
jgi:hypothetical protein